MTAKTKRALFSLLALIISVAPTVICVLTYFPLWRGRGAEAVLSGFTLLLLLLSYSPLLKLLKRQLESPSVWGIWLVLFLLFTVLSRIADEMCVISLVGFISNLAAAGLWHLADRFKEKGELDKSI